MWPKMNALVFNVRTDPSTDGGGIKIRVRVWVRTDPSSDGVVSDAILNDVSSLYMNKQTCEWPFSASLYVKAST